MKKISFTHTYRYLKTLFLRSAILFFLCSIIFPFEIFAQGDTTYINGGLLNQNTTWTKVNSPYVITGDLDIEYGTTLTIEPGVLVLFDNSDHGVYSNYNNQSYIDRYTTPHG